MRRLLYWYLPLTTAILAAALFAWGFIAYARGDRGAPVNVSASAPVVAAPANVIAPVILGDSLARGAGDESGLGIGGRLDDELKTRHLHANRTYNLGINGARTPDLLHQLEGGNVQSIIAQSNVVIVSIGGNDLWGGNDWKNAPPRDPDEVMDAVLSRVADGVSRIRKANPRARIFFIGLYNPFIDTPFGPRLTPLVKKWNAKLSQRFANDGNLVVVQTEELFAYHDRLSADRFHPSGEGYGLIARRIADAL
jgi:lysophospholipase L1-like esterase